MIWTTISEEGITKEERWYPLFLLSETQLKKKGERYMSVACVQDIYKCDTCKSASDEHGRNCRHGMLFPLLLLMGNCKKCMNYEFDAEKVKLQLQGKENERTEHTSE